MEGLKASVSASAAFAPPDSPSNPGSASGFRVNPCIIAPETASPAPTKNSSNFTWQTYFANNRYFVPFSGGSEC